MTPFEVAATRALSEGRRWQRCPACRLEEAAGSYCTACLRPVHPDEWIADVAVARAARERRRARNPSPRTAETAGGGVIDHPAA